MTQYDYSDIVIVSEPISTQRLLELAAARFGDMVKAVVDTDRRILALGGDLHSDEEAPIETFRKYFLYSALQPE